MSTLKGLAGKLDIELNEGTDFTCKLTWLDASSVFIPLTGYTAEMQVRGHYSDVGSAMLTLSSPNSGMVITADSGTIDISIDKTENAFGDQELVYDLKLTDSGGETFTFIAGTIFSIGAVTK